MADPTAQLTSQALELASLGADLYSLLDIPPSASENDIRRAWRKVGLKYHPDRVGDDTSAKETYERCRVARDILLEPVARAAYDSAREAEVRRQTEREKMDRARRDMVEDLERREAAARGAAPRVPSTAAGVSGVAKRSAEEEEKLRRAFARGREIEKQRRRMVEEAEERERAREEEARGKSLGELDKEEEELKRKLEAVRERKAARDEARRARKSKGPVFEEHVATISSSVATVSSEEMDKTYGSGRRRERARLKALAEQESEREKEREMKAIAIAQQKKKKQIPPPPPDFDPSKKYTMDDFENTLRLLVQAQEAKIAAGKAERIKIPLEEKSFEMPPGGRTIRVPKYSFSYRSTVASRKRKDDDDDDELGLGGGSDNMDGVEHAVAQGVNLEDAHGKLA